MGRAPLILFLLRSNSYREGTLEPPSIWMLVMRLLLRSSFLKDLS